ncbi:hypothetical protein CRUP_013397 [Coryphaenoides rupestris]|nr:hypothetical protein CRUP_013397 [Coryphaenoides rupestris]
MCMCCVALCACREGRDQLEGQGSIQDKITVCATDDCVPGDPREAVPGGEKTAGAVPPSRSNPEPLIPVARLSAKDSGYLLRDDFYRLVQKDWPGYSEDERQLLGRVLARGRDGPMFRFVRPRCQKRPVPSDPQDSGALKRPRPADAKLTDGRLTDTRLADSRLADARLRPHPPPVTTPTTSTTTTTSPKTKGGRDQTSPAAPHPGVLHAKTGVQTPTTPTTGLAQSHAVAAPNGPTAPTPISPRRPEGGGGSTEATGGPQHPALAGNQHKKKKSKKHKDKERERERLRDPGGRQWLESSPDLKQSLDKLHDAEITNAVQSEEKPDYVLKYPSISSLEQRQCFQTDFCGEYSEYIDLHARIANVTHMFVQLASKIKSLSPGTQQHKIMEDQIMEKYKKYRNKFPGYREEKKRCEYLHEKLSHIKQLITDYDVTHASSSPSS